MATTKRSAMRPEIACEPDEELALRMSIQMDDRGMTQLLAAALKHRESIEASSGNGLIRRPVPLHNQQVTVSFQVKS